MELRCLCRYLLKQLLVLKFLMEGGREFQIDDPENARLLVDLVVSDCIPRSPQWILQTSKQL